MNLFPPSTQQPFTQKNVTRFFILATMAAAVWGGYFHAREGELVKAIAQHNTLENKICHDITTDNLPLQRYDWYDTVCKVVE